ncbi:MAG: hypothetical protein LBK75_02830 [Oscillospiraceae bacterium]|jgi:hypothetical protein|nr:hypothetical protein [Oscillospiraceae bacterium]
MRKNAAVALPVVLVVIIAAVLPSLQGGAPSLSEVESISVLAGETEVTISDPQDIRALTAVFSKIPTADTPACPFGAVDILLRAKGGDVHVFPATDGCHIFKLNSKYILASAEEWAQVMDKLEKYCPKMNPQSMALRVRGV